MSKVLLEHKRHVISWLRVWHGRQSLVVVVYLYAPSVGIASGTAHHQILTFYLEACVFHLFKEQALHQGYVCNVTVLVSGDVEGHVEDGRAIAEVEQTFLVVELPGPIGGTIQSVEVAVNPSVLDHEGDE